MKFIILVVLLVQEKFSVAEKVVLLLKILIVGAVLWYCCLRQSVDGSIVKNTRYPFRGQLCCRPCVIFLLVIVCFWEFWFSFKFENQMILSSLTLQEFFSSIEQKLVDNLRNYRSIVVPMASKFSAPTFDLFCGASTSSVSGSFSTFWVFCTAFVRFDS